MNTQLETSNGMKNILWPGFLTGIVILLSERAIAWIFQYIQPSLADEYVSGIFRPWSDPRMMLYFLYPFISGFIMAYVWSKVKVLFTGETATKNGLAFGLYSCLVFVLPGMFVTYTSFVVSFAIVLSWTVSGVIGLILAGVVLAKSSK